MRRQLHNVCKDVFNREVLDVVRRPAVLPERQGFAVVSFLWKDEQGTPLWREVIYHKATIVGKEEKGGGGLKKEEEKGGKPKKIKKLATASFLKKMLDRGGKAEIKTGVHRKTHHDSYDRKSGEGATMDVVAGRHRHF